MKKIFKRLIGKGINMFNHIRKIGERILKVTVQSVAICCPVVFVLVIINAILGVNIRFSYYLILAGLAIVCSSIILCAFKWEQIIAKPIKVSKRTVPAKTDRKTQRAIHRKRKRIS
ncbi:MAG TPA: hypothetical protein DDY58_06665 [Terrisporobacter glycolicus]|uniref:hypothetical protein n=1 Tax=Terrisporobacter TaxID=1505652 RepID=UPI000E7DD45A|nr:MULTISPECIES: hypothetical protein [Terrisporobacter]HBI92128.1 hypothetical protein [Terrisporobacter hibernicus]